MTKKMTMATIAILAVLFMAGIVAAVEQDPKILSNGVDNVNPIPVGVDPNPISPPVSVEYDGWNFASNCGPSGDSPCSTYEIIVTNDATGDTVCTDSGAITGDPFTVTLPTCKIPATSVGVSHTITAEGNCNRGDCDNKARSKHLGVDAGINPTPEVPTVVLTTAGLIGLVGLVRCKRKD